MVAELRETRTWTDEALVYRVQEAVEELLRRMEQHLQCERRRFANAADDGDMAQAQRNGVLYAVFHFKGDGGKTFRNYAKMVAGSKLNTFLQKVTSRRADELDRSAISIEGHIAAQHVANETNGYIDAIRQVEDRDELARMLMAMPDEFWQMWASIAEDAAVREKAEAEAVQRKVNMVRLQRLQGSLL